ncbi:MAG: alpha-L-rhamnosidase-related protein [Pirellulaceae bacterium]
MRFTILILFATLLPMSLPATEPDFQSRYLAVGLSRTVPAFSVFAVDSLGQGKLEQNPVLVETNAVTMPGLELNERLAYTLHGKPVWQITCEEATLTLRSDYIAGEEMPPLTLAFNQKANHATLLGLMKPGERQMSLPCVLHLPDMGSLRITGSGKLDYDARRFVEPAFVRVAFPPATVSQPLVEYRLEVAAIYPQLPGIEKDPLYDGFRRDWLNIFQVNPRVQMLANNASSDPCSFTLFEYSDLAVHTPPLADGLTCLDLIRMTLDRYLAGAKGYGQTGYASEPTDADLIPWKTPSTSLDTFPSLLISACNYVRGSRDIPWARANYAQLAAWGRAMFAADKDGNGLIEYPGTGNYGDRPLADKRPSNWWDTINFGHEDAFANALAYHAASMFADLARDLQHTDDAQFFTEKAAQLRAAYTPTFLNPATGVLAGWKSADGQLHDYWFTFVQGAAITYGLLDDKTANAVMDRLLAKMHAVGYTRFDIGLPGNLVPIKRGDYADHDTPPQVHGVPKLEDGSDGFQYYENGGATGCWAYYTVKALCQLGRVEDARRIFHPILSGYARGEFQGFGENGMSRDWRDWQGGCHGYEGLLVDNYHALLAVLDDVKENEPRGTAESKSATQHSTKEKQQ